MSLVLTPIPHAISRFSLDNNNPGTEPDYTEHDVITLRRYNGEPLNHTQADDNLELLRRLMGLIGDNIHTIISNITNIGDHVYSDEYINLIKNIIQNEITINNTTIRNEFTDVLNNWVDVNLNEYIDNRVSVYVEETLYQRIENYVNDTFVTLKVELGDQYVLNSEYNTTQQLVTDVYEYIDTSINTTFAPHISQLDLFETKLAVVQNLLGGTAGGLTAAQLTAIIDAINDLSGGITDNASNISSLNVALTALVQDVTLNRSNINILDGNFKKLEDAFIALQGAVNAALVLLKDTILKLFKDLTNILVIIAKQVAQNTADINVLFELLRRLSDQFFDAIISLWNEIGNIWAMLEALDDRICRLEQETATVLDFVENFSWRRVDLCMGEGIPSCEIKIMQWGTDCDPDNPDVFELDFKQNMNSNINACDPEKFKQFKDDADQQKLDEEAAKELEQEAVRVAQDAAKAAQQEAQAAKLNDWGAAKPNFPQAQPVHLPGQPIDPGQ
jgi:hypothetical protein